jgi:hypothetical protein
LPKLRYLAIHSTGNTLAYCLTSLSRLLELDKGWDHVTDDLIKRVRKPQARGTIGRDANGIIRSSTSSSPNPLSMSIEAPCRSWPRSWDILTIGVPRSV